MVTLGKGVDLPAEIAGRRTAVFGLSGSGKSNSVAVIVEQLIAAGEQVIVIDPKGEGVGFLSTAAGKPSSLDFIVFGSGGHIPVLTEHHGPQLADFAVETGRSIVLSLVGFDSDNAERRFVATFLRQLFRRKSQAAKATRTLVVLEEAHLFIPEGVRGEGAELAGAVQRIVRQGRSFGLGTLLVDQRPQDVSKRVVTQCDTLVCHQLTHQTDRAALGDWVKGYGTAEQGREFMESVASLQPGEAWLWSPSWLKVFKRVKVNRRATYDTGAAPDGTAAKTVKRAEVDLDALKAQLGEIVEKAKLDDPKELRRRIADLERKLAERTEPIEIVDPRAAEHAAERTEAIKDLQSEMSIFRGDQTELMRRMDAVAALFGQCGTQPVPPVIGRSPKIPTLHALRRDFSTPSGLRESLTETEKAVLDAAASFPSGATRQRIAIFSGRSPKSSSFQACFSGGVPRGERPSLVQRGLLIKEGDRYSASKDGGDAAMPMKGVTLDDWASKLTETEAAVLRAIAVNYPEPVTREDVSLGTGRSIKSSSFQAAFPALRDLGLIEGTSSFRLDAELAKTV